jgi:hypothetical protein
MLRLHGSLRLGPPVRGCRLARPQGGGGLVEAARARGSRATPGQSVRGRGIGCHASRKRRGTGTPTCGILGAGGSRFAAPTPRLLWFAVRTGGWPVPDSGAGVSALLRGRWRRPVAGPLNRAPQVLIVSPGAAVRPCQAAGSQCGAIVVAARAALGGPHYDPARARAPTGVSQSPPGAPRGHRLRRPTHTRRMSPASAPTAAWALGRQSCTAAEQGTGPR